ncbi:MAG: hypothetical protein U0441_01180 [Polyangiaceae bacterium]
MGIWDSVRSTVDRVTGNSANVALEADTAVVKPGQSVGVRIAIKNGLSPLEVRALLLEIEAIETIDLPRHANWANVVQDVVEAGNGHGSRTAHKPQSTNHSETTWKASITVSPAMTLAVGEEKKFQGTFKLPPEVQPTYAGKYATHAWRMRARLDVFGTDPSTGWHAFRVISA